MHSWIFRNRDRLRRIYGERPAVSRREPRPAASRPEGRVERRGREVVLVPSRRAG